MRLVGVPGDLNVEAPGIGEVTVIEIALNNVGAGLQLGQGVHAVLNSLNSTDYHLTALFRPGRAARQTNASFFFSHPYAALCVSKTCW